MSDSKRDPLDQMLAALPREVEPQRDLWPGIRAQIESEPQVAKGEFRGGHVSTRWFQLAAGVLLVIASSVTTYVLTRESMQGGAQVAQQAVPSPQVSATPASFAFGPEMLGAKYVHTRAELDQAFQKRIASMPPATRVKLERNLADLRQAARDLAATLAEHPSDPLLQELLMSTYQSELQLLAEVSELPVNSATRADL